MSEEVAEKIDPDALAKSLNGFEEIAIRAMFRAKLEDLAQDSTMFMRALVFVMHKRGGMKDSDAFQTVMATALDEVVAQFGAPEEESADLIVVGNKGMTGAKRFLLGSVPNKVSHHAPCSVLIIRTT